KALEHRHGAAAPYAHAAAACPATIEAQDGADVNGEHGAAEPVIVGEEVAQAVGQREYPLADGDVRKHRVDQMRGQLRHAPPAAARAEASPLAREWHEALVGAVPASDAGEAAGERPAGQELAELALDELREAAAVAARGDLGEKGLEIFADDPVENGALRSPGLVADGTHARCTCQRRADPGSASRRAFCGGRIRRTAT